jgi:hypothetical protein
VNDDVFVVLMFGLVILAGVAILWMAMQNRRMQREFEHRERLAMIERGLVPPPELDPAAFESRTGLTGHHESRSASRSRSAGIIMIGFGLGLTMLISFAAGEPEVGIGIGGAFALLGAAFVFNSMAGGRHESSHLPPLPPLSALGRPLTRPVEPAPRTNGVADRSRDDLPPSGL